MEIAQIGEAALIRLIEKTTKRHGKVRLGIGDDACVLKDGTVITTDAYEQSVHFDTSYMTFRQIGTRCACAAVSDIVAMGARPRIVLVALALTRKMHTTQVRALYQGIEQVCSELDCEVVGGDIIASNRLLLAITAIGKTKKPKLRSDTHVHENLYVTGNLGTAEAGRLVLKHGLPRQHYSQLVRRHLKPIPRLSVIKAIGPKIHGLIDISDGIGTDARHLAERSEVRIVLEPESFPVLSETRDLCARLNIDLTNFALSSGEDYELLFTSPKSIPEMVEKVRITRIGRVEPGSGLYMEHQGKLKKVRIHGYDHLLI